MSCSSTYFTDIIKLLILSAFVLTILGRIPRMLLMFHSVER